MPLLEGAKVEILAPSSDGIFKGIAPQFCNLAEDYSPSTGVQKLRKILINEFARGRQNLIFDAL